MDTPIQFIPEIPESKLDASVQSKLNTGGGSLSSNQVSITLESELYDIANADKILLIQNNITLTANRTLPNNVTLVNAGGYITGSFTLTGDNSTIIGSDRYSTVIDGTTITIAGTWKNNYYSANWFNLIDTNDSYRYNNHQSLQQGLSVVNSSGGILEVQAGEYYTSCTEWNPFAADKSVYLMLSSNVWFRGVGHSSIIKAIPNDGEEYAILYPFAAGETISSNIKISDIWLYGEREEHDYTTLPEQDQGHCIYAYGAINDLEVFNCKLTHAKGDGFNNGAYSDFPADLTETDFEFGNVTGAGVLDADTDYIRTTNLVTLSAYQKANGKIYIAGGGSYTNSVILGLPNDSVWLAWYDNTNTFIEKSAVNYSYEAFNLKDAYDSFRVIVVADATWNGDLLNADFGIKARTPSFGEHTSIYNNIFQHNRRDHISNPPPNSKISNNTFLELGSTDAGYAGPGYGIRMEDGYGLLNGISISGNYFKNMFNGAVSGKYNKDVTFINNIIDANNGYYVEGGLAPEGCSVDFRDCFHAIVSGGVYKTTDIRMAKGGIVSNITLYDGGIYLNGRNSTATSINAWNAKLSSDPTVDGRVKFNNISLVYDKPLESHVLQSINNAIIQNVNVRFMNGVTFNNSPNMGGDYGGTSECTGFIDTLTFEDTHAEVGSEHRRLILPVINTKNSYIPSGIDFGAGTNSHLILDNNTTRGLYFTLTNFGTDNTTYLPVTIKNSLISTLGEARYITASKYLLETETGKDINLKIDNTIIDIDVTGEDNLLRLLHDGTTEFTNSTFKSVDAISIELDTYAPNTAVSFKGCEAVNVSFTRTAVSIDINNYTE